LRQVLADLDAGDVAGDGAEGTAGRPARFHIESVDLTGAAVHEQEDAVFLLLFRLGRGVGRVEQVAPVGDGQAGAGDQRSLEESAAVQVLVGGAELIHRESSREADTSNAKRKRGSDQ